MDNKKETNEEICKNCKYFYKERGSRKPSEGYLWNKESFYCRKNAPQCATYSYIPDFKDKQKICSYTTYPTTEYDQTCGEFEQSLIPIEEDKND